MQTRGKLENMDHRHMMSIMLVKERTTMAPAFGKREAARWAFACSLVTFVCILGVSSDPVIKGPSPCSLDFDALFFQFSPEELNNLEIFKPATTEQQSNHGQQPGTSSTPNCCSYPTNQNVHPVDRRPENYQIRPENNTWQIPSHQNIGISVPVQSAAGISSEAVIQTYRECYPHWSTVSPSSSSSCQTVPVSQEEGSDDSAQSYQHSHDQSSSGSERYHPHSEWIDIISPMQTEQNENDITRVIEISSEMLAHHGEFVSIRNPFDDQPPMEQPQEIQMMPYTDQECPAVLNYPESDIYDSTPLRGGAEVLQPPGLNPESKAAPTNKQTDPKIQTYSQLKKKPQSGRGRKPRTAPDPSTPGTSQQTGDCSSQDAIILQKKREQNRIAAANCRRKRAEKENKLKETCKNLEETVRAQRQECDELNKEIERMARKCDALEHENLNLRNELAVWKYRCQNKQQ